VKTEGLGLQAHRPKAHLFLHLPGIKNSQNNFRKDPSILPFPFPLPPRSLWCVTFCSFHTLSLFFSPSLSLHCFRSHSAPLTHHLSLSNSLGSTPAMASNAPIAMREALTVRLSPQCLPALSIFSSFSHFPIRSSFLQLGSIGINPQFITFTHVTMESDKYICVRETAPQNSVVMIDMAMPMQPLRRPITADSALMNPNARILALKGNHSLFRLLYVLVR